LARKILLADDSVTAQNMGRKILADAGYEVITVNNGSAALKKIGEHKPDLIVLDVYMPGYSGLEVCQRLKEVAETARIPILLTVGKLEPFKTDEAKRVRADGFIVKPFEASELLSALSKMEDKIVPRAEASKPGRLARATAAIEEGRDRTVAAEEDTGWKSRISFPSKKKKESAAEADGDDPAIYNPVNKDLRTVIGHEPVSNPRDSAEEERVDLGALAPEGLPKDVTPEEIAALAAAAAQVQGKVLESKIAEDRQAPVEMKVEPPVEPAESTKTEPALETATFAEQIAEAKAEPSPAENDSPIADTSRANLSTVQPEAEPVTMAAAAGAQSVVTVSRWTAVAVGLAPEESGISLEQEMQKAYAEFAAQTETGPLQARDSVAEPPQEVVPLPATQIGAAESADEIPATVAPAPAAETPSVASVAIEATTAAVKEFETVSAPVVAENDAQTAEAHPAAISESPVAAEPEASPVSEAKEEPTTVAVPEEIPTAENNTEAPEPEPPQMAEPELHTQQGASSEPTAETPKPAEGEVSTETSSGPQISEGTAAVPTEPAVTSEGVAEKKEPDIAATTAAAWASWRRIRESGDGHREPSEQVKMGSDSDAAAMAVAAGAEKSPEDSADAESDPAIASIVDSVLADLRPKIVEEISRKLGKKK
jgi:CheY-like chemotaxis protein